MYELKIEKNVPEQLNGKDLYARYLGKFKIAYKGEEGFEFTAELSPSINYTSAVNGVCGAATITGFNVFINRHSTNYREIFKPDNRYLTVVHYLEKLHPKAILEVRDTILQYMADLIIANATGTITFGGRCNINRVAYLGSFGVHSGTFARHIVRNKLGTITCSHLHQNTSHRSYDDFSLQQVFIWSPPQVDVMPIDRRYCGIFRDTKHPLKGLERILADFKKATKEWVMLKPRYALKDPFTPDNEGIVK